MSSNTGHLKWYIDGTEEMAARDQITWSKTLPNGVYQIKMEVLLADNTTTKIVESTLVIGSPFEVEICAGKGVTFTAHPSNGGTVPAYQWYVNGTPVGGATASTYYYVPANGDVVNFRLTSNALCATTTTVMSHNITVIVNGPATITTPAQPPAVCAGSTLTLTTPNIQLGGVTQTGASWTLNGAYFNPSSTVSYAQNGLGLAYKIDTDCGTFTSGTVAIVVMDKPTVGTFTAPGSFCTGQTLNITAPSVQNNGAVIISSGWTLGTSTITMPATLTTADNGKTLYYSAANACGTTTSGTVLVSVSSTVTPAATITASQNNVCSGTAVTYTVTNTVNGGTTPGYQWRVNGTNVGGATASTYSYMPDNGDVVTCVFTSSAACAAPNPVTSNGVTMTITPTVVPSLTITAVPD
jgi:hypothetical protein